MTQTARRILSYRLLTGEAPLGYEPEGGPWEMAATAARARDAKIDALLAVNDLALMASLARGDWRGFEVLPLVPNVVGYIRDTVDFGLVGAGTRRLRQLGPMAAMRVGFAGLAVAPGVLRKEFPALLRVLFEVEACAFRAYKPERFVLAPQITDLAVAFDNAAIVELFASFCRSHGVKPCVATNNPSLAVVRLRAWGVVLDGFVAPLNREGYLCGDRAWAGELAAMKLALVADVLAGGRGSSPEDEVFAAEAGAREVIIEADALRG